MANETTDIVFTPVIVNKGRKFRGKAYLIGDSYVFSTWQSETTYLKMWDPISKSIVSANEDFCEEDNSVPPEKIKSDCEEYIKWTFESTYAWCMEKRNGDETAAKQFARNILLKRFPSLKDQITEEFPDQRDVAEEIQRTLQWAMNLKTRETFMYGRHCPGGKPLPLKKKLAIAYNSLERKKMTAREEFKDLWNLNLTLLGCSDLA